MARPSKMSAQKRLRERERAEKAERKREARRVAAETARTNGSQVAEREDLERYGVV
jgi:hypothetical protein